MNQERTELMARLEQEFAYFARWLEANNRSRTYPLERAHYLLLLALEDGPKTMSRLAGELALDESTVTRQVAAMQRERLVRRTVDPADKRAKLVQRTEQGTTAVNAMRKLRLKRIGSLFEAWTASDCEQLASLLGRANDLLAGRLAMERGGERRR